MAGLLRWSDCGVLLGVWVGVVVAVLAAGGAGPGLAAVGVAVHGPVAFVLEAVVVSAEAVQVVWGGLAAGGERFAVVDVGELRGPVAAGESAGPVPEPDVAVQRGCRGVFVGVAGWWLVGDPDVDPGPVHPGAAAAVGGGGGQGGKQGLGEGFDEGFAERVLRDRALAPTTARDGR